MDTIYSEAFEHLPSQQVFRDQDDRNTDAEENIKAVLKKRSGGVRMAGLRKKSLQGSGRSLAMEDECDGEYVDSSEINPRIPSPLQFMKGRSSGAPRGEEGFRPGHTQEESSDYQYAYSTNLDMMIPPDRRMIPVPQRSVSLKDDYSNPPDRLSKSSGRPNSESQDYAEPYQSQGYDTPLVDPDTGGIYELAKDITPPPTQKTHPYKLEDLSNRQYSHLVSGTTNSLQNTCINEEPDSEGYDHLNSWQHRRPVQSDLRISGGQMKKTSVQLRQGSATPEDFFPVLPSAPHCTYEDLPSEYQDPWDTEEGQKKFSRLMQRAEKTDGRRQSEDATPGVHRKSEAGTKPKDLQAVHLNDQGAIDNNANLYSFAWDQSSGMSAGVKPMSNENKPTVPQHKNRKPIVQNYEEAWDTEEKQKQFEETLANARRQRLSEGRISSHDAPTVDDTTETNRDNDSVFTPAVNRNKESPRPPSIPSPVPRKLDREKVSRSDSCKSLAALAEKVDRSIPLEDQCFFHGGIKRSEAERMLCVFKDGSYLIRRSESNKKDFSLTLKGWNGIPMHMKITSKPNGTYILGENSQPFYTIPEMVEYYTRHELPVQDAQRICLLYPIPF